MITAALTILLLAPQSNPEAEVIYAQLVAKLKPVKTLSGKVEVVWGADKKPVWHTFRAMKPNFFKMESEEACYYIDGKFDWAYMPKEKRYNKAAATPDLIGAMWLNGFEPFLNPELPKYVFMKPRDDKFGGRDVTILRMAEKGDTDTEYGLTIDKETGLPAAWEMRFQSGEKATGKFKDLVLDEPMKPEEFQWKIPAGAKPMDVDGGLNGAFLE